MKPMSCRTGSPRWRGPVLLATLAAGALVARPAAAQKVTLRWKYRAGMEMVYRVTNHQDTYISMGGASSSDQTQTMRWKVTEVAPNGDATVSMTTERVQIEMQGMAGNLSYDSESGEPPSDPQARLATAMAGMSYTMVISPDGSVKSIQGIDKLRDEMLASMPPEQVATMQAVAGEMFSEESMTRMAQQNVQVFPAEAVGPGDTWDRSFTMAVPVLGEMTTKTTFTLTGTEQREGRTIATIATSGDISMGGESSSPVPMTIDLGDTKMGGTIDFDTERGITVSSTMTTSMQMNVDAGGQQMSMTMNGSMTTELIEFVAGH
jgi:hypothetical protein